MTTTTTRTDPVGAAREPVGDTWACIDGNEAAASVAHRLSDICALYPITPASPMGEAADAWSARGRTNIWGQVPRVVQMQSEAGAVGALHGAVQSGALATSFTSSQGLLLMLPNMFKIAGELTPAVLHVAARAVATHALSIFGDHSDVMAARSTGWGMLSSSTVQEAHDIAAITHAASLTAGLPFLHFFDGFRTSHEINRVAILSDDQLRAMVDDDAVLAHRRRAMTPTRPVLRGTAQNPDVFFQGREAANPVYDAAPGHVTAAMARFADLTGRRYDLVEYHGDPQADRVVVVMGSAARTVRATVDALNAAGERVGMLYVRLYRPFPAMELAAALPRTVTSVAVLDRVKEPGATAEPLHLDVVTALSEHSPRPPRVIGGRYGLGSKEFAPRHAAAVFAELAFLAAGRPVKRRFTVGITDDVTHLSLDVDPEFRLPTRSKQAVFFGLGSDGTVGANKASVTLIGENAGQWAQGYFVYDSKKSGSTTVSHLRFGAEPIDAPYLVEQADFVGVHQLALLSRLPVLDVARPGATVLLASPHRGDVAWSKLPAAARSTVIDKDLTVYTVNAAKVARRAGLGGRINTVMQACFFALSDVLPTDEAIELIKASARTTYASRGADIVAANLAAIDAAVAAMTKVVVPDGAAAEAPGADDGEPGAPGADGGGPAEHATIRRLIAGEGELLPVSALPPDGTFPTGTAALEKRGLATQLPVWDPMMCIDCGKCTLACPHAAIRMKSYDASHLAGAPDGFLSKDASGRDTDAQLTLQVAPDDCTGCALCQAVCPSAALTMMPAAASREAERARYDHFRAIPETDRTTVRTNTVRGSQLLQPLFEFSGACSGCGETPYLKLVSQLLGDRMVVANATGCSSIYGGNLPTTPWTTDASGRGPAWNNSLFEDNAEFGMGLAWGSDQRAALARDLLRRTASELALDGDLVAGLLGEVPVTDEQAVADQRDRVARLLEAVDRRDPDGTHEELRSLREVADALVPTSVWVVGGDGWAYDIGFGGLDHLLASGENVNVLVLDSEVYSNTGGQASKATPLGAAAKFAASGKETRKKDLGRLAQVYQDVYVAQIAINANEAQAVRALHEAAAYDGPSLVIAYAPCREQGADLTQAVAQQRAAVATGHWLLYRYHPEPAPGAAPRFKLDSKAPSAPLATFYGTETRYRRLALSDPERAAELLDRAQAAVDERWLRYSRLAEA
ncbi:pyruvate:ferredoxin (flavodoxin) oxidoreductase [Actinotalea sp. M2MS4P-6]|uniref:pyruvate:ferredoxin (flavodoxin) oxidoreductase n=1 Tax=Actinotalea sp. M2MS4P-6 TaxID=2983762 RepID=UPI0021E3CE27|nr:pyruvate:ferredoxin (flavodoxin) oxidoreductase [Actinotalea sp. M2MS4P-6]MCV2393848.1 pyruvate:ferredoxin (flavodoxin) oxidoreductase [Actinotalea sp. M2MS4P-6]